MRILLLTDEMFPGGVQRHVCDLANRLVGRNYAVTVAGGMGEFVKRLDHRVRFLDLPFTVPPGSRKSVVDFVRAFARLRENVKMGQFDVIHSHQRYSSALAQCLSMLNQLPHVVTCHSLFHGGRIYSFFGSQTIAVSQAVRTSLIERFRISPDSVSVIYNEVEVTPPVPKRRKKEWLREMGLDDDGSIVALVGRFVSEKDFPTAIEAVHILQKRDSLGSVRFVFVGYGIQREELLALVNEKRLGNMVKFLPAMTDVSLLFQAAQFGTLASVREAGIPYSILEAASLGKPYIATDVDAIPEFIEHEKNGLLVPPRRPDLLADAIELLLKNPQLVRRLGANARRKYEQHHRSNGFVEKTIEVYRRAVSGV